MKLNFKILILGIVLFAGCKKYDNPPPVFEDLKPNDKITRKVLVVSIDGVGGNVLKEMAPPTIASILPNSKYTYSMFKSAVATDVASWASMLTGASFAKHNISSDDFQIDPTGSSHGGVTLRNNFIDLVGIYKAQPTAVVTPWANLRKYLNAATFKPEVTTDVAVKDSAIAVLNRSAGLTTMVVNFREAEAAGTATGDFSQNNAAYKTAILNADGYLKEVLDAVKARKTYAKEEWLVIVTTNHGGSNANPTSGFLVAYYPTFKSVEFQRFGFNLTPFNSQTVGAKVNGNNDVFDSGASGDFTVQMQTKFNNVPFYPMFLSKSTPIVGNAQTGWGWFVQDGSRWGTSFGGTLNNSGVNRSQIIGGSIVIGKWQTLTMTVKYLNTTTRTVTTYTDGVQNFTGNITAHKSLSTSESLAIGFKAFAGGTNLDFFAANLAYFNTALSTDVILANKDLKDITKHPNYNNLVGFWKMNDGAESLFQNTVSGNYNMTLNGSFQWSQLGSDAPSQSTFEAGTGTSVNVTSADVGALSIYWLKLKGDQDLDGKNFLKDYEIEFLK